MPASFSHQCTVQVKLELGHRAQLRKKPTTEGFTHDWMVFVRGPEQCEIQHFVEKVVFWLHDSFPKPKRGECCPPPPPLPTPLPIQAAPQGLVPTTLTSLRHSLQGWCSPLQGRRAHTLRFWLAPLGMPVRSLPVSTRSSFDPIKVPLPPFCSFAMEFIVGKTQRN